MIELLEVPGWLGEIPPSPSKAFTFALDSSMNSYLLRVGELQNVGFSSLVPHGETAPG